MEMWAQCPDTYQIVKTTQKNYIQYLKVIEKKAKLEVNESTKVVDESIVNSPKKEVKEVIYSVQNAIIANYVDLDLGKKMSESLNTKNYYSIKNPNEFAQKLTNDLQFISKDKHLKLNFEPERIAQNKIKTSLEDSLIAIQKQVKNMKRSNFGFLEQKILEGNIGYLDLRYFADVEYAKETIEASMAFLANTNAIIIDLRQNGGGVPSSLKLLSSYFFNEKPVLLNTFYNRSTDETEEFLTEKNIKGKRLPKTSLYILTSRNTFSAAEAFAYNLKHLDRAIIVGSKSTFGKGTVQNVFDMDKAAGSIYAVFPVADSSRIIPFIFLLCDASTGMVDRPSRTDKETSLSTNPLLWASFKIECNRFETVLSLL